MLDISWKNNIINSGVRGRTGQQTINNILRKRRLRWLGHPYGPPAHITTSTVLAGFHDTSSRDTSSGEQLQGIQHRN